MSNENYVHPYWKETIQRYFSEHEVFSRREIFDFFNEHNFESLSMENVAWRITRLVKAGVIRRVSKNKYMLNVDK